MGGTWERFGNGRVLIGVDASDSNYNGSQKTGGSKEQALRALIGPVNASTTSIGGAYASKVSSSPEANYAINGTGISGTKTFYHSTYVKQSDGKEPTTIQPYITVYRWRRAS